MPRSDAPGFTLIELLAAMLVGALLVAAMTSFYLAEQRAMRQQRIEIETSQALRVALDQIVRDLRVAGFDPLRTAGAGVTLAAEEEVRFTLDANANGTLETTFEETKGFRINGTTLETRIVGIGLTGWLPLVGNGVEAYLTLGYARGDGTPVTLPASAADLAAIRRVDVELTLAARVHGSWITRTEVASVELRNRS